MYLEGRQKELAELALDRGYLTFGDFDRAYASPQAKRNAIQRLVGLGLIEATGNKFVANAENLKKVLGIKDEKNN